MEESFLVLSILLSVVITVLFSICLIKRYTDPRDSSCLTTTVGAVTMSCTLLAILLIPVDIWSVSSSLNEDGTQSDPTLVLQTGEAILGLYYTMYIVLCTLCFLILPFTYFYYEEDDPDLPVSTKSITALKYTSVFVIFFFVLLSLGFIVKSDKAEEGGMIEKLAGDFNDAEDVLFFCLGSLACIGMTGYVIYAAYGLGMFPLSMFHDSVSSEAPEDKAEQLIANSEDVEIEISRVTEKLKYLTSKYDMTGNKMSKKDKTEYTRLRKELSRLRAMRKRAQEAKSTQHSARSSLRGNKDVSSHDSLACVDKCWNCFRPLRLFFGVFFLLFALLIIVSLFLSSLDKFTNSSCGADCGFAILTPSILNPLDETFQFSSKAFPVDLFLFAFLVLFVFICCVYGLIQLGVRFFVISLYPIKVKATPPNGMLMAAWYLAFMLLVFNLQVLTLAPQYASYGQQFYTEASNSTLFIQKKAATGDMRTLLQTGSDFHYECDLNHSADDGSLCVSTQIASIINAMNTNYPFFGIVNFYGNVLFLFLFICFQIYGIYRCVKKPSSNGYQSIGG